jgi:inosose dehydratase
MTSWRIAIGSVTWGNEPAYYWITPPKNEEMLDGIVAAGYSAIEWSLKPSHDPALVQRHLVERGLKFVGSFCFVDLIDRAKHETELARVVELGKQVRGLGGDTVILCDLIRPHRSEIAGRVTIEDAMPESEHQAMTLGLNLAAEKLAGFGVRSTYHPHAGTLIETRYEFERLLSGVDESLIGFCPDTGHIAFAGDDPVAAFVDYADRITHVHIKDVDGPLLERSKAEGLDFMEMTRRGVFAALGKGTVDLTRVVGALNEAKYQGWIVVEQDAAANPLQDSIASREFLESVAAG